MFYMCIEYHIQVNMYHVNTQGVDERMINAHYYYYRLYGHTVGGLSIVYMETSLSYCGRPEHSVHKDFVVHTCERSEQRLFDAYV